MTDTRHEPVGWAETPPEESSLEEIFSDTVSKPTKEHSYVPLIDSLRLYAGWLLGWYFLLFALSSYQRTRHLPFQIPLVDDLSSSSLVIDVTFGVFLFLLLTSLHRQFGRHASHGILLLLSGVVMFILFVVNVN